jgi:hypothetical protein
MYIIIIILSCSSLVVSIVYYMYYNSTKDITAKSDINEFLLGESVTDEDIKENKIYTFV